MIKTLFSLILLALSVFSAAAQTCPQLAGNYSICRSSNTENLGSRDIILTQKMENNITTYYIESTDNETNDRDTFEYIADGISRSDTASEEPNETVSTRVTCDQNSLKMFNLVVINGQEIANLETTGTLVGKKLSFLIKGTAFGSLVKEEIVCE